MSKVTGWNQGRAIITDASSGATGGIDSVSEGLITIGFSHHEVHEGDSYFCDAVDASMGSAATLVLAFKTPAAATGRMHMLADFTVKAEGHMDVIEGPTWDNQSGTQQPVYQRFRPSASTTSVLEDQSTAGFTDTNNMGLNPTTLAGGTTIHTIWAFSSKVAGGSSARGAHEMVLAADTQYAIRVTADAAANAAQLSLIWYEHVDSN